MTLTEGMAEFMKSNPEGFARIRDSIPMQRGCRPEEVASLVLFLLSDESAYITATCLTIDGGKSAHLWLPH